MAKEATKALLSNKQVDCFSCKWGSGDLGCSHPSKMHLPVSLPGFCKLWQQAEDMNEPWHALHASTSFRRCDMMWK